MFWFLLLFPWMVAKGISRCLLRSTCLGQYPLPADQCDHDRCVIAMEQFSAIPGKGQAGPEKNCVQGQGKRY